MSLLQKNINKNNQRRRDCSLYIVVIAAAAATVAGTGKGSVFCVLVAYSMVCRQ